MIGEAAWIRTQTIWLRVSIVWYKHLYNPYLRWRIRRVQRVLAVRLALLKERDGR